MYTWPTEEPVPSRNSKAPASLDLDRGDMTATRCVTPDRWIGTSVVMPCKLGSTRNAAIGGNPEPALRESVGYLLVRANTHPPGWQPPGRGDELRRPPARAGRGQEEAGGGSTGEPGRARGRRQD